MKKTIYKIFSALATIAVLLYCVYGLGLMFFISKGDTIEKKSEILYVTRNATALWIEYDNASDDHVLLNDSTEFYQVKSWDGTRDYQVRFYRVKRWFGYLEYAEINGVTYRVTQY